MKVVQLEISSTETGYVLGRKKTSARMQATRLLICLFIGFSQCFGGIRNPDDRWVKLNHYPVCFGAKNDQFGRFNIPYGGNMAAVKLVHLYGYVSCDTRRTSYWSYWGCGDNPYAGIKDMVNVKITTSTNHIIWPPSQFTTAFYKWSKIPGYHSLSPELILSSFSQHSRVHFNQQLRLWYAEDLLNQSEGDNGGRACCDVYGLYV